MKKGDKVIHIGRGLNPFGKIGTVLDVEYHVISVEFEDFHDGHSCGGRGKEGCCWHVLKCDVELYKPIISYEIY